jgi:hypothetical protein
MTGACIHDPKTWTGGPKPAGAPPKTFDVVWKDTDLNGLPLNPEWSTQVSNEGLLPGNSDGTDPCNRDPATCTSQGAVLDKAPAVSACTVGIALADLGVPIAGPIAGHLDWGIATYEGVAAPVLPPISNDEDFNVVMIPTNQAGQLSQRGLTWFNEWVAFSQPIDDQQNHRYIEMEFDSLELQPRLSSGGWWGRFAEHASAAIQPDAPGTEAGSGEDARKAAAAQVQADWNISTSHQFSRAIAVGLFNTDCEHGCKSEIHPVYLLAVETNPSASQNEWKIFARNWGDGGSCSTLDHLFGAKTLSLTLRAPQGGKASAADITPVRYATSSGASTPPLFGHTANDDGLTVTFSMGPPGEHQLQELEIAINWGPGAVTHQAMPPVQVSKNQPAAVAPSRKPQDSETLDEYVALVAASIKDFHDQVDRLMGVVTPPKNVERTASVGRTVGPAPPSARGELFQQQTLGKRAMSKEVATWTVLCRANNNKLPLFKKKDISGVCKSVTK